MKTFQQFLVEVAAANGRKPNVNEVALMEWAYNFGLVAAACQENEGSGHEKEK